MIGKSAARLEALLAQTRASLTVGDMASTLDCCRRAARLDPRNPALLGEIGILLHLHGCHADAVPYLAKAAAFDSRNPDRLANLAVAHAMAGAVSQAIEACERALALRPGHPAAGLTLARIYAGSSRQFEAEAMFRRLVRDHPGNTEIVRDWAAALESLLTAPQQHLHRQQVDAAARIVAAIAPDHAQAWQCRGSMALVDNDPDLAIAMATRSLRLAPAAVSARLTRSGAFFGRGDAAAARNDMAVVGALMPGDWSVYLNLGAIGDRIGETDRAMAALHRAVLLAPDRLPAWSNLLCATIKSDTDVGDREAQAFHRASRTMFGDGTPAVIGHRGDRLRIGYVSPDFRSHSCAWFIEPLLARHDPRRVEVFAYADVARPDAVTDRLQALCPNWSSTLPLSDDALTARIRQDRIDVLVDLAGHFHGNRLGVFGRRAAPVQVTWLGYNATTGLGTMDWKLVDRWLAPPGQPLDWFAEQLWRLPRLSHCYRPPQAAPSPVRHPGQLTFGSFNTLAKLSPGTIDLWSEIMMAVPQARLLLKADQSGDSMVQARFRAMFARHGVVADRVQFLPYAADLQTHLALYGEVDVALDPLPYNGTTTTCEALWMGVPVVTLAGNRLIGRVGASLLGATGLDDLVATDRAGYVAIAAALAADHGRRADHRHGLRARIARSPLCDETGFAKAMEQAFVAMLDGSPPR